jgi:hypothetical protein
MEFMFTKPEIQNILTESYTQKRKQDKTIMRTQEIINLMKRVDKQMSIRKESNII